MVSKTALHHPHRLTGITCRIRKACEDEEIQFICWARFNRPSFKAFPYRNLTVQSFSVAVGVSGDSKRLLTKQLNVSRETNRIYVKTVERKKEKRSIKKIS